MKILDAKTSAVINDTLYFDDVSINLWSTKTLAVISDNQQITVSTNSDYVYICDTANTKQLTTHKQYTSTYAVQLNNQYVHNIAIAVKHDSEITIAEKLNIDNKQLTVCCNIVDEDDRLNVLLSNNKFVINEQFIAAFKETDVDEHYTDYVVLNQKRQELLIDLFSIKSFVGVYAGLVNALKYFGYDNDVIIKEFWSYFDKAVNDYRLSAHNIETDVSKLPLGFIKTNMFSLTYKFNDVGDYYTDDDLPVIIENFDNVVNALTKMHNMRIVLETYFLPAHAIIVEIVGEYINFSNSQIRYYIHNAVINYYSTEIENIVHIKRKQLTHQYTEVILAQKHDTAVFTDSQNHCVQLLAVNDTAQYDNDKSYYDNFAYVEFEFNDNFDELINSAKIIVTDSLDNKVLEFDYENSAIVGFLNSDNYEVSIQLIDKFNVIHIAKFSITTEFVKHRFDIYTTANALSVPKIEKRNEFSSTQEAFEYFSWYKNAVNKLQQITAISYANLDVVNSYDSHLQNNIADYKLSNNTINVDDISSLAKYRGSSILKTIPNDFVIDVNKHTDIKPELYQFLNKSYFAVHINLTAHLKEHSNIAFTVNDIAYDVDLANLNILTNSGHISALDRINRSDIGDRFDAQIYEVRQPNSTSKEYYLILLSNDIVDITKFEFATKHDTITYKFVDVITHHGAVIYADITTGIEDKNIEIYTDGGSHTSALQIFDVNSVVEFFRNLPSYLGEFDVFKLSENRVAITCNKSCKIIGLIDRNIMCRGHIRKHLVQDLVKLDAGSTVENYSIVFAKIDESVKCRPYDIEWKIYEHNGNSTNIVKTSNDYFVTYVTSNMSSYSIELMYYEKQIDMHQKKNKVKIVKPGEFIVSNKFDTLIEPFRLSTKHNELLF